MRSPIHELQKTLNITNDVIEKRNQAAAEGKTFTEEQTTEYHKMLKEQKEYKRAIKILRFINTIFNLFNYKKQNLWKLETQFLFDITVPVELRACYITMNNEEKLWVLEAYAVDKKKRN